MLKNFYKKSFIVFIILIITVISLAFFSLFSFKSTAANKIKLSNQSVNLVANPPTDQIIQKHSLDVVRWNANANFSSSPTSDGGLLAITESGKLERIDSFGYLKWELDLKNVKGLAEVDDNNNLVYDNNQIVIRSRELRFVNSINRKVISEAVQSKEDPHLYYLLAVSDQTINNDLKNDLYSFQELSTDITSQGLILKVREDPNRVNDPVGVVDYANISPTDLIQNYPNSWKTDTLSLYGPSGSFRKEDHPSWFGNNSNFISLPWLQYITNLSNIYEYKDNVFIFGGNGNWINNQERNRNQASKYLSMGVFRVQFNKSYKIRATVTGYPYAYLLSSLTSNDPDTQRLLLGQNSNYTLVPRIALGGVKQGLGDNKNYVFLFGSITTGLSASDNPNQVVLDAPNYSDSELDSLNKLTSTPLSANNAAKNSVGPRALIGLFFNLDDLISLPNLIDQANINSTYYLNQNSYSFRLIAPWTTTNAQPNINALNVSGNNKSITGTLYNLTIRHRFNENDVGGLIDIDDKSYGVAVGPYILRIFSPALTGPISNQQNWLYRLSNTDFINYDINSPLNFNPIFNFKDFRGIGVVNANKNYLFSLFAPSSLITTTPKLYYTTFSDQLNSNVNFNVTTINRSNGLLQFNNHNGLSLQNSDFSYNIYSINNDNLQDNGIINPIEQRVKFLGSGQFNPTSHLNLINTNLIDLFEIENNQTILKPDKIKSIYKYFSSNDDNQNYQLKLKVIDLNYEKSSFRLVPYVFSNLTNDYQIVPDHSNGLTTDSSFASFKKSIGIDSIYLYVGIGVPILILIIGIGIMTLVGMALMRERKRLIRSFRTNNLKVDSLVLSIGSVFKSLIHSSKRFKRLLSKDKNEVEQKQMMQKPLNKTTTISDNKIGDKSNQSFSQPKNETNRVNFSKIREYKAKTKMVSVDE
ncbi:cytadherence protein B [[Mycoplasma] imitans]|uniref:cytadherence protein B n=1 Tax=[Mycoplasma] imitans TaxID=29560 RepID=UPI0004855729|nr:cytadherence protein B [[Mycoplasma] imitans]